VLVTELLAVVEDKDADSDEVEATELLRAAGKEELELRAPIELLWIVVVV